MVPLVYDAPQIVRRVERALLKSVLHDLVSLGGEFPEPLPIGNCRSVFGAGYGRHGQVAAELVNDLFNGSEGFNHALL